MTQPSSPPPTPTDLPIDPSQPGPAITPNEPAPSYVKLAMRNMVKKGGQSLVHFGLTVVGLLALLVGLAYLTR
ncbi:MAG: DUF3285 domain-containing protein [Synechococcales cyanobacterium K44_A2020_017]|nr:DUF3285 domain-containing protein [Synechococcales cyanobacterium K32_A2020_035]MBF2093502.1 DUF3285 domain-containing protein [Synechococcales cyanobacterium K44_A2020_017]